MPLDLEAIRKREQAATPGPWQYDEGQTPFYNDAEGRSCGGLGNGLWSVFADLEDGDEGDTYTIFEQGPKADALFIAHARTDIPALLAELTTTRAMLVDALAEAERGHAIERAAKAVVEADAAFEVAWNLPLRDGRRPDLFWSASDRLTAATKALRAALEGKANA